VTAVNTLIKRADTYYKQRRFKSAAEIYKKISLLKPKLFKIRIKESRCYYETRDYDAAEILLKDLVAKFSGNIEVLVELADFYIETGKLKEAGEIVKIAERKNPRHYMVFYVKGCYLLKAGKTAEAIKNLSYSLKLKPDFFDVHIDLGNAYYQSYKYSKAEAEYKTVFSFDPDNLFAIYNLGVIFLKKGKYQAALRNFMRTEPFLRNFPPVYFHLGKACFHLKKYKSAMQYMKKAADMDLKILYVWGLANTYIKLRGHPSYNSASMKKKAMALLNMCVQNTKDNKISLMARRAILKLNPREKLLYAYRIPIDVHYTPVLAGDFSYFYSDKRRSFVKIEKETENIVWEYKESAPPSCPFRVGDQFYTGLENGTLIAINKEKGGLAWKYNEYVTDLKPVKQGILAINGDNDQLLYLQKGKVKWEMPLDDDQKHKIAAVGEDILYHNDSKMIKINRKTGKPEWEYDLSREKGSIKTASASDKYVFISTKKGGNNFLLTLTKTNGKKLWDKSIPAELQRSPLVYVNRIVCILKGGKVYNFYKDGSWKWNKSFKEEIISGSISGNKLYISFESAKIYGLAINTGQVVWSYKMKNMTKDQIFMIYYTQ